MVFNDALAWAACFFSFSRDVHKALLLLNGISLPDRAINISLALSYLACGPTQRGREGGREVGAIYLKREEKEITNVGKDFYTVVHCWWEYKIVDPLWKRV